MVRAESVWFDLHDPSFAHGSSTSGVACSRRSRFCGRERPLGIDLLRDPRGPRELSPVLYRHGAFSRGWGIALWLRASARSALAFEKGVDGDGSRWGAVLRDWKRALDRRGGVCVV